MSTVLWAAAVCAALAIGFNAGIDYQQSDGYADWCHAHGGEMTYLKEREAVYCASVARVRVVRKGHH